MSSLCLYLCDQLFQCHKCNCCLRNYIVLDNLHKTKLPSKKYYRFLYIDSYIQIFHISLLYISSKFPMIELFIKLFTFIIKFKFLYISSFSKYLMSVHCKTHTILVTGLLQLSADILHPAQQFSFKTMFDKNMYK